MSRAGQKAKGRGADPLARMRDASRGSVQSAPVREVHDGLPGGVGRDGQPADLSHLSKEEKRIRPEANDQTQRLAYRSVLHNSLRRGDWGPGLIAAYVWLYDTNEVANSSGLSAVNMEGSEVSRIPSSGSHAEAALTAASELHAALSWAPRTARQTLRIALDHPERNLSSLAGEFMDMADKGRAGAAMKERMKAGLEAVDEYRRKKGSGR